MRLDDQRGELSLFWCAILVGLLAMAAMTALMSMRYDRNLFFEVWGKFSRTPELSKAIDTARQATRLPAQDSGKPNAGGMRKCTINGSVTYSNVECDVHASSTKVDIHITQGINAPKIPEVTPEFGPNSQGASTDLQGKPLVKAKKEF